MLRPWRAKLTAKSLRTVIVYGMALGGMNFLFYMSLCHSTLGNRRGAGVHWPIGSRYLRIPASDRLSLDRAAAVGLLLLIPTGATSAVLIWSAPLCTGSRRVLGLVYSVRSEGGADNAYDSARGRDDRCAVLLLPSHRPRWRALLTPSLIPIAIGVAILSTALPTHWRCRTDPHARANIRHPVSIEPAFGALSGLLFLQEYLPCHMMAILCIILASVGATLTMSSGAKPAIAADETGFDEVWQLARI